MVRWKRIQSELQHRWGLVQTGESESLRKEWLDKTVPVETDDSSRTLTLTDRIKRKWAYSDYAHVKEGKMGKSNLDSARYSSKGMHAARLCCSALVVTISACVVVLFSLSALVMRTRGANTIVGSVSVWTAVEFQDVSIEFWTVYEEQCERLIPTPCDEKTWVDNINQCGECKVLVDNFVNYGGLCDRFCRAQGLDCVGVWDEIDDSCAVKPESQVGQLSCSVPYLDSSDAICECAPPIAEVIVHASTCDPPDPAEFKAATAVYGLKVANSTARGIEYGWRHSEQAVVRSPARCNELDGSAEDCSVETLHTTDLLSDSVILQAVPAATLVVPEMLNIDVPHSSLPRRVPVYEPSCDELGSWVNASQAQHEGLTVGLLREPSEDGGSLVVRKAEWSIASVDVTTSMLMFADALGVETDGTVSEGCTIQMGGAVNDTAATALATKTATYFREPDPELGQILVYASTALSVAFIGVRCPHALIFGAYLCFSLFSSVWVATVSKLCHPSCSHSYVGRRPAGCCCSGSAWSSRSDMSDTSGTFNCCSAGIWHSLEVSCTYDE